MNKPKIYVFSNGSHPFGIEGIALAEDGTVVDSHICSNEGWISHDLGATSDWHHEVYMEHYPAGFDVEYVPSSAIDNHAGLQSAISLAQQGEQQ